MFCTNCGNQVTGAFCAHCGTAANGTPAAPQQPMYAQTAPAKSRTTAGILGILLGGIGVHKFYMGKVGAGLVYLLLCWTWIPAVIGLIEGIIYLVEDDARFNTKLNNGKFF
jgi:TM2 domain-containing membrane protein YozV